MHYKELLKEFVKPVIKRYKKVKEVVEFDIYDGFDDSDPHETVKNLISLYVDVLRQDPNWHFFNEGDFMVVRCSTLFAKDVKKFLDDNNFTKYNGPKEWNESTFVTQEFQYKFFMQMFHAISEGVMTLVLDKRVRDGNYDYCIKNMAERMIHAWFNHNIMPAIVFGKMLKSPLGCQYWEASVVGDLALDRSFFGGRYEFLRKIELTKKKEKKEALEA